MPSVSYLSDGLTQSTRNSKYKGSTRNSPKARQQPDSYPSWPALSSLSSRRCFFLGPCSPLPHRRVRHQSWRHQPSIRQHLLHRQCPSRATTRTAFCGSPTPTSSRRASAALLGPASSARRISPSTVRMPTSSLLRPPMPGLCTCTHAAPAVYAVPADPLVRSSNAKWPFSLSHNRLQTGGWARQQNRTSFYS